MSPRRKDVFAAAEVRNRELDKVPSNVTMSAGPPLAAKGVPSASAEGALVVSPSEIAAAARIELCGD
jgi:hypothetical protein